jgi:pimeloyl-ACP methyl ester carboxylesterase/tetratricopeptide (TPR) repeat protein
LLERAGSGEGDARAGVPLLERADALAELSRALRSAQSGAGRLVLVLGEAGVGKTSIVEEFVASRGSDARVLHGACDPLLTPRALGPILDIAADAGGTLERAVADDVSREALFDALREELGREAGTVVVLEDMHWADEGSLDVFSFLGRRIAQLPCLLVATARDDGSPGAEALRATIAELPPAGVSRLEVTRLSPRAVDELARRAGRSSEGLHALTGGNAFFVTEVLATEGTQLPPTVKDAVAARCRRLSPAARDVLETVSVVPGRVEPGLLETVLGTTPDAGLEECFATGMLEPSGGGLRFRHEIARLAVEESLTPVRRAELERRTLEALVVDERTDLARVVHHARLAGADESVRRYAPEAAAKAAAAGAHREALEHYRAALAVADAGDQAAHADLLEGFAVQAYLCGMAREALDAFREALPLRRALGDPLRIGDDLRWTARLLWWLGHRDQAQAAGEEAVAVLEGEGPSHELAMALGTVSQLDMLAWRPDPAIAYGQRALEVARAIDDVEAISHALTNVGSVLLIRDRSDEAIAMLEEAFALADGAGLHDHAARALVNSAMPNVHAYNLETAGPVLDRAVAYSESLELSGFRAYALGHRSRLRLERGNWRGAEADALEVLRRPQRDVSSCAPLVTLALLRMRRGESGAAQALDQAQALAAAFDEQQRLAPVAAARAELAWLADDLPGVASAVRDAYERALQLEDPLSVGELAFWLWRAGELDEPPALAAEPHRRSIEGDWRGAADAWERIGAPYARAEALSHAEDGAARREAVDVYESFGARVAAERLRRQPGVVSVTPQRERRAAVQYARSGDLDIAYQVTGSGPVDVVLVPGFVSHLDKDWEEPRHAHFLDRLGSFARLIRFDKRGTGLSDRPGDLPDLEMRMDDLRAVMDAAGVERAVLFGYSEGGPLSVLFTATYPERVAALVLYGVFAKRVDPDDDYPWAPTQEARAEDIRKLVEDWGYEANLQTMCPSADEDMARWWGERCRAAASPGAIRALMKMNSLVDVRAILPSIHVPTLVVHRSGDVDTSVEEGRYVASRIPGAVFVELAGRDHFVAVEPDQILDVAEPFIRQVEQGPPAEADRVLATVLMTDLVGSTETLSRLGDRAFADLLTRHHQVLENELERFSGELVETTGDGVLALFDGPSRAIRCGEAIHVRLAALGLAARVGLHTGEIERRRDGPRGIAVHLAARVMAEAGPGEVLVTATTRDLVAGSGLAFTDRGERLLKGIEEPRRLYAVVKRA